MRANGVQNPDYQGAYAFDNTDTTSRMRLAQATYALKNPGKSLMQDLRTQTHTQQKLVVEAGHYFSVLVPFAARFAYETWIVPHRHVSSLAQMNTAEVEELAAEQLRSIDPDRWQP
jgi:UDPglucose--hexose-1-phosphate uridylyltransferase